jgi:hypothetical protein
VVREFINKYCRQMEASAAFAFVVWKNAAGEEVTSNLPEYLSQTGD